MNHPILPKLIIRHKSGSKANQVEEFALDNRDDISIGRDIRCDVNFDQVKDDLVSRRHMRITISKGEGLAFTIEDLGSSNGTFLNGEKLLNVQELLPEDVVQLGKDGPKFVFDINPRPKSMATRTRMISGIESGATRIVDIATTARMAALSESGIAEASSKITTTAAAVKTSIGKDTVQMMLTTERKNTKRLWVGVLAGVAIFVGAGAGALYWRQKLEMDSLRLYQTQETDRLRAEAANAQIAAANQMRQQLGQSAQEIAQKFAGSTAEISVDWRVHDADTGHPIFHKIVRCKNTPALAYVRLKDGSIMRWLTLDDNDRRNLAISGSHTGTGFVVSENGFILTNKHVASSWSYESSDAGYGAGVVFDVNNLNAGGCQGGKVLKLNDGSTDANTINSWKPENGGLLFEGHGTKPLTGPSRRFSGRNEKLEVRFAGSRLGVTAALVRSSNDSDAALLKIESPQALTKFELAGDDQITVGERMVVIGYPGVSVKTYVISSVYEGGNKRNDMQVVPQPTVTEGIVSLVAPKQQSTGDTQVRSGAGETFQLAINTTGSGNSGGPVLNASGKVVGLYTYTKTSGTATVSLGIPIKFGRDLLQTRVQ